MLTSIVILNWNGLEVLRPCLAAIAQNTPGDDYEVIVLDNGSEEDGLEEAVRPYPKVRLIKEPVNHGFSRGNNLAVRQARGEYLVFLNNDTLPRRDWLRPLIELQREIPDVGIVGAKLVDSSGRILFAGSYFQPSIDSYFGVRRDYPASSPERPRECELCFGCGILIGRELFEAVGGFDERYFQGFEDYDLCLKVRERGLRIMYCPESIVEHIFAYSMKKLSRRVRSESKRNNRRYFERRWRDRIYEFRLARLPEGMDDFSPLVGPPQHLIDRIPDQAGRVLDAGCNAGVLGERLKLLGKASYVAGIESRPHAAALALSRLDSVHVGNVESLALEQWSGQFDTLVMADVMGRVRDPWAALFRLRDCLKAGGTVVASFYNIGHYKIIKKLLFAEWRYEVHGPLDHAHLRFFTRRSIEDLFRNSGFEILRIERDGRTHWWSWLLGPLSKRVRDFAAVQYYVTARKRPERAR